MNTKVCQLQKFLRFFFSLQKCLFEISTTYTEKLENANFRNF